MKTIKKKAQTAFGVKPHKKKKENNHLKPKSETLKKKTE